MITALNCAENMVALDSYNTTGYRSVMAVFSCQLLGRDISLRERGNRVVSEERLGFFYSYYTTVEDYVNVS